MTVTGGIKFFEKSKCLYVDGARAYSLRGTQANYILNHNRGNGWESTYSNDSISEQLIIDLSSYQEIDRIFLNQHNFKDVTIYLLADINRLEFESDELLLQEDGSSTISLEQSSFDIAWNRFVVQEDDFFIVQEANPTEKIKLENFYNVSLIPAVETLQRTILDSNISTTTSYYEFSSTRCIRIVIEVTATQTANEQKKLNSLIITNELGTFEGFPTINKSHDRNFRSYKTLSGKNRVFKGTEATSIFLGFENYPGQTDHDLIEELFETDADFLVWPCGGREGSNYFTYDLHGFTIDDLYLMQVSEALPLNYTGSVFMNPYETALNLVEVEG